jgi:hypothetical protein
MRLIALLLVFVCLGGCVTSKSLLGQDEAFVIKSLGQPQNRHALIVPDPGQPPAFGPSPRGFLRAGEPFVEMSYTTIWGDWWYIVLASPSAFERVHGNKPPKDDVDCVIDVQVFPSGTVF